MKINLSLTIAILLVIIFPTISNGNGKKDKEKFNFETDSIALVKLYEECNGANWLHSDNWLTGPLSSWYGVAVGKGRVVALELFNDPPSTKFGLTGQLPVEIWNLNRLKTLNLSANLLPLEIPPEIENLENLEVLDLSYTAGRVQGVIPREIANIKKLKVLKIAYGRITGLPDSFSELKKLETLDLSGNQADFDISSIEDLKHLKELYLQNNRFEELGPLRSNHLRTVVIANNYFAFDDIIPNIEAINSFIYSPQKTIVDETEEYTINQNETIDLTANYHYPRCNYQWLLDGVPIDDAIALTYTANQAGEYTYIVSHDDAPELNIPSNPKLVIIDTGNDPLIYAALEAFYNATNGDNWSNNDNWLSDKPFNEWYGISEEEIDGEKMMHIVLQYNNLTGYLPPEIGDIPNLKNLDLLINNLTGEIPHEIGKLKNLADFCLLGNQMTGELPDELFSLQELGSMDIGGNNFEGELSPLIGNLHKMRFLTLGGNNFEGELPTEIYSLTNLYELGIGGNNFEGEISQDIFNLTDLNYLDISSNNFTNIPDLSLMNNLQRVWINSNYLGFEHIIPLIGKFDILSYTPQGMVDTPQQIEKRDWEPVTLEASYQCDGAVYRWQRWSESRWWDIEGENGPTIEVVYNSKYQYFVTHPEVPDLELQSYEKEIIITEGHDPAIYAALEAFYNATNGDNWLQNDNWLSSQPLVEWYGFSTEDYKGETFIQIELPNNNLSGYLPAEIGDIPNLRSLYLMDNNITGTIPPEIGKLNRLRDFYLPGNYLTGELPDELFTLTSLGGIGLSGNELEGQLSPLIGNLQGLMYLAIGGNQFYGELPIELYSLDLYELIIGGNNFEGEISPEILNLTNLNFIEISSNQITGIPDFSSMENLQRLYVTSNYLGFEHIIPLTSKTYESFSYSPQNTIVDQTESFTINAGESIELIANYTYSGCTFQWYKDENIINDATGSSFFASETGNYYYEVSHPYASDLIIPSNIKTVSVVTNKSAKVPSANENIDFLNANTLNVFPNPVKNTCNIQIKNTEQCYSLIELYDSRGKKCKLFFTGELPAGSTNLKEDMSNYTSGIYFIRANINEQITIKKLIKTD